MTLKDTIDGLPSALHRLAVIAYENAITYRVLWTDRINIDDADTQRCVLLFQGQAWAYQRMLVEILDQGAPLADATSWRSAADDAVVAAARPKKAAYAALILQA